MTTTFRVPGVIGLVLGLVAASAAVLLRSPDAGAQEAKNLEYEVLSTDTEEPMSIQVTDDGRVIWVEREGAVKVRTLDGAQVLAGRLPVSGNLCNTCEPDDSPKLEEGGLYTVLLAPDFNTTGRLYLVRSMPGSRDPDTRRGTWRISTFVLDPATNQLDLGSEQVIFEWEVFWDECCHYGGDLDWLPDGTLLLSTGDDTPASSSEGYGPRDASETWLDAELRVLNPADVRGKILRMMPDGSVPDGSQPGIAPNPHIGEIVHHPYIEPNPDTSDVYQPWVRSETGSQIEFNPYVYAMGFKQPFKGTVNPYTGHAFYGDVGPDASEDDPERGPEGYDERNVITPGGGTSYGWPRCIGPNWPYRDVDWETMQVGDWLNCSEQVGAVFYYPHGESEEWPQTGTGGTTGSPVAFYPADTTGALRLPAAFDDTVIDLEWSRHWFATFDLDDEGGIDPDSWTRYDNGLDLVNAPFIPQVGAGFTLQGPIDADVGPDGAIYIAEYGSGYYQPVGSGIGRLICGGCTPEQADYQVDEDTGDAADVVRREGTNRFDTAVAASRASFPQDGSAAAVVLARGDSPGGFPDALAGVPLARDRNAPLLLSMPTSLPGATAEELQRVLPEGGTVIVLGGDAAISPEVRAEIEDLGYEVQGVFGDTRYATAVAIAEELGNPDQVLLATGTTFPDALSAGPAAVQAAAAILLTPSDARSGATDAWLEAHDEVTTYAVGGPAARQYPDADESFVGTDRVDTALQVAAFFFDAPADVGVARTDDFPDALSGGARMAHLGGPILLTPTASLHERVGDHLCDVTSLSHAELFGGTAALSTDVETDVTAHLDGTAC